MRTLWWCLKINFQFKYIWVYHDWCESFNTHPWKYDLLHANDLFSNLELRKLCFIIFEMLFHFIGEWRMRHKHLYKSFRKCSLMQMDLGKLSCDTFYRWGMKFMILCYYRRNLVDTIIEMDRVNHKDGL